MAQFVQLLALAVAALLAVAYRAGLVGPDCTLFLAYAISALYTGQQLLSRLDMPLGAAFEAVLARPESRANTWTYWVYLTTLAISAALIVQILLDQLA